MDYWMEMSDTVKPRTSFLIEDILSVKDSTRFNGKCCSQNKERFSGWEEESEKLSEQLSPLESAFGIQTGELMQCIHTVCLSVNGAGLSVVSKLNQTLFS